jgi:hypothetical protein
MNGVSGSSDSQMTLEGTRTRARTDHEQRRALLYNLKLLGTSKRKKAGEKVGKRDYFCR